MAIHTRMQLDPSAEVSVRLGADGSVEVLVLDPQGDASGVIGMSPKQMATICEAASVQYQQVRPSVTPAGGRTPR